MADALRPRSLASARVYPMVAVRRDVSYLSATAPTCDIFVTLLCVWRSILRAVRAGSWWFGARRGGALRETRAVVYVTAAPAGCIGPLRPRVESDATDIQSQPNRSPNHELRDANA